MVFVFRINLLFAALATAALASVIELDDSFSQKWKTGTWLVKFYAPWCGYCKRFEPTWNDIGKALETSTVQVARLDCTKYNDVAAGFGIRGMPTVKLFYNGHEYEYEGRRDTKPIIEFVQRATGPAVIAVNNLRELSQLMKIKDVIYLMLHDATSDDAMAVYKEIARQHLMNSWFYESTNEDIRTHLGVPNGWGFLVLKDSDFYHYNKTKGLVKDEISAWVSEEKFVAFATIDTAVIDEYARSGKLVVMVSLGSNYMNDAKLGNTYSAVFKVAKSRSYHPQFYFVFTSDDYVIQRITLGGASKPCIVVVNFTSLEYYTLTKDLASSSAEQSDVTLLLDQIKDGRATPLGGKSWFSSAYRLLWDIVDMFQSMWRTQPILFFVMSSLIALLVGVLVLVICCSGEQEPDPHLSPIHEAPPTSAEMPPAESIQEGDEDLFVSEKVQVKQDDDATTKDTKSGKQKED